MNNINRRAFLAGVSAVGLASTAWGRGGESGSRENVAFLHGVASGDPLHDRVILWTRLTPRKSWELLEGRWSVSRSPDMKKVVARGRFATDFTRDFTVKVDAGGLAPDTTYYYRFDSRGARSPVGRTRTLPLHGVAAIRFAFASCSNYPYGYFNAYARIAERHDLSFVLHLGDYLYEYEKGGYANPLLAGIRDVVPDNEMVSLQDYRLRHALYKSDPDLQEAHRQHPFICVWDDHEATNDAWRHGAENHNPEAGEGEWEVRRRMAIRAYNEYMPIRSRSRYDDRIYRRFRVRELADLLMLDTRLHGRDLQAAFKTGESALPANDPVISAPGRTLLGFDQEAWLERQLWSSTRRGATWRVLGQQVMMAQLSSSFGASIINPDQWDGYRPARERLYQHLLTHQIRNNVVLTGDIHSSWTNDLTSNPWDPAAYNPATGAGVLGAEFVTPAVTSPGPIPDPAAAATLAGQLRFVSPHLKYIDLYQRGYGVVDLSQERAQCEIYHVPTVDEPAAGESLAVTAVSEAGNNVVRLAGSTPSVVSQPDPAPLVAS